MDNLELETMQAHRAALADASADLIWACGPDGKRNFFNARWLRFTGRELSQELGAGWMTNIHPKQREGVRASLESAREAAEGYRLEYRLLAHDGKYHSLLESGTAQFASDGTFLGFIGWCTDIRQDRSTKTNLPPAVSEKILERGSTNTHSPIGIWKLDSNLEIISVNKSAAHQLGLRQSDLVGHAFFDFVPSFKAELSTQILGEGKRFHLPGHQVSTYKNEGRVAFWDIDAWPLMDGDKTVGMAISTLEVTERKRIEQQKEDFVATLVHDLKTPLIGADRALQILLESAAGQRDGERSKILELLKNSNYDLLTMVQNLIEVYRFEEGNPKFLFEPIAVDEVIEKVINDLTGLAEQRALTITRRLPEDLSFVSADPIAIRRVFQNLLDNAIKFTNRGGTIEVSAEDHDDSITYHVKNSGEPISEEELAHFFRKFWQGEKGRNRHTGSGLGLFLCKQIVDAHKGSLSCTSSQHDGTTFSVTLPKHVPN